MSGLSNARSSSDPLERAVAIAVDVHHGQRGRDGFAYILHPMWIMSQMDDAVSRTVAALHDVVEDSDWTIDDLRAEGFSDVVVSAVDALSRRDDETYEAYIERLHPNPIARKVKLADLRHNMDVRRLPEVTAKDAERLERYRKAYYRLLEK